MSRRDHSPIDRGLNQLDKDSDKNRKSRYLDLNISPPAPEFRRDEAETSQHNQLLPFQGIPPYFPPYPTFGYPFPGSLQQYKPQQNPFPVPLQQHTQQQQYLQTIVPQTPTITSDKKIQQQQQVEKNESASHFSIPKQIHVDTKGRISYEFKNNLLTIVKSIEQRCIIEFPAPTSENFIAKAKNIFKNHLLRCCTPFPCDRVLESKAIIYQRAKFEELAYRKYNSLHKELYFLEKRAPLTYYKRIKRQILDEQKFLTTKLKEVNFCTELDHLEHPAKSEGILLISQPGDKEGKITVTDELLKALKQVHKNSVRAQTYHKALADLIQ